MNRSKCYLKGDSCGTTGPKKPCIMEGCTSAQPGKCDRTIGGRQRCGIIPDYFDHSFSWATAPPPPPITTPVRMNKPTCYGEHHLVPVFSARADVAPHVSNTLGALHVGISQPRGHVIDDVNTLAAQLGRSLRPEVDQVGGHVRRETRYGAVEFQRVSGRHQNTFRSYLDSWSTFKRHCDLIYASAYGPLSAFKTQEIDGILKTSGRCAATTSNRNPNPTLPPTNPNYTSLHFHHFCTQHCALVTENKHTANVMPCLRTLVIVYVLNADSGR